MTLLHRAAAIARWIVHRRSSEADLDDEMRTFVEMAAADHARSGASPVEARRRALQELGGLEQVKERVRAGRHGAWLDRTWWDLRYGLRQLRRTPMFTVVAISTLALGIGVNTAVFSAIDAVLLRPLPYQDADRLVMVWDDLRRVGDVKFFPTPPEWREWRRQNTVFTDIAATQPGDAILSNDGEPEDLSARKVTANFWTVLGVTARLGRTFTEEEDTRGARVVVISHGLWQRRFGGARDVVGRTMTLNDMQYEVIGVMPREFYFLPARDVDVWMPTSFPPQSTNWFWHDLHCVARLKNGVSVQQAHDAMAALNRHISAQHVPQERSAVVFPLRDELTGKTSTSLLVLLGAGAAVLLIACVNLANLLLARGTTRRREVAVRAALGAGRARLVTQFTIEHLLLAALGAAAGLVVAVPIMRFFETLVPETMSAVRLSLDWRVLTFSAVIAILAGLVFGLAPAVGGTRLALTDGLRDGGRGSVGSRSHWFRHGLVIAETTLAVVLLTTSGLLAQTYEHLRGLDLGIRSERLLTLVTPLFRYKEFDQQLAVVETQLERIRAIPGVVNAGAISRIPLSVNDQSTFYLLAGQPPESSRDQVALTRIVTRDYFATVGAALREGRFFDASDRRSQEPVVVVNESFAARNYPGRSPIGQRFKFQRLGDQGYWYTIVGVVREIRDRGVAEELRPAVYRLHDQADQTNAQPTGIVVRTAVDPASVMGPIRDAIWSIDRNQPISRIQTIDQIVKRQLAVPSQNTVLIRALALLGLLLSALGLYGVLSYAVMQRTREIGVRMALGASSRDVLMSVTMRGLLLTLAGLALGLALSVVAARLMTALFYGFEPDYTRVVIRAAAVLLFVAAVACLVPARRAARVDPIVALQQE